MEIAMSNKILITPRSLTEKGHPGLERLRAAGYELVMSPPGRQPDEADLLRLLPGCVGYLAGVEKITARVLESAVGLRVISRNGVGCDAIDRPAAERLGIKVCVTPGANSRGVAELTVGLLFALVRALPASDAALKAGQWQRAKGVELSGRTLGVIGCGQIGRQVAGMAVGIGMNVLGYDVFRDPSFTPGLGFSFAGLPELLAGSDAVSLHCPMQADGRPLLDRASLGRVKQGAWLINTARAGLVDAEAVLEALDRGLLAGFATDVFAEEPPQDARLVRHPLVIATPHIGGFTEESVSRAVEQAVDNLVENLKTLV
jgi:phosphoglycerate dehydrogenase-like enzyme